MPNFRTTRKFRGPAWLVDDDAESSLVGYVSCVLKDAFTKRLKNGLLVRFPQQDPTGTPAPDDALAAMGRDRGIIRGRNEDSTAYARRLLPWWDDWKVAGNPFALMKQIGDWTGPGPSFRTVDVRGNWFSRAADGTQSFSLNQANWDWDGASDALVRWSRFWVIMYPNGVWTEGPKWGDPGVKWGTPGQTWGSTMTSDEVATLRAIVRQWKPAGTRCVNIILAFDSTSFDPTQSRDGTGLPDGTWGGPAKIVGGQYVASRLSTARYLDGV